MNVPGVMMNFPFDPVAVPFELLEPLGFEPARQPRRRSNGSESSIPGLPIPIDGRGRDDVRPTPGRQVALSQLGERILVNFECAFHLGYLSGDVIMDQEGHGAAYRHPSNKSVTPGAGGMGDETRRAV